MIISCILNSICLSPARRDDGQEIFYWAQLIVLCIKVIPILNDSRCDSGYFPTSFLHIYSLFCALNCKFIQKIKRAFLCIRNLYNVKILTFNLVNVNKFTLQKSLIY